MKNDKLAVTALIFLLLIGLGCTQLQNAVEKAQTNAGSQPNYNRGGGRTDDATGLTGKGSIYIKTCANQFSRQITNNYKYYTSWVKDIDRGPTGKESSVSTFGTVPDIKPCLDGIAKAKTMEPSLPEAEAAADRYGAALKEVSEQINGIYSYYEQGDYKDDKFKKGIEAHPAILKAFNNFKTADDEFSQQIDKIEDQVAEQQLTELKNKPEQIFEYQMVESNIAAKKIAGYVETKGYAKLIVEEFQPLVANYEKSFQALKPALETGKLDAFKKSSANSFISDSEDFLTSAKELLRRKRDNKPFSEMDIRMGDMTEGSPEKLIKDYNSLIETRNRF